MRKNLCIWTLTYAFIITLIVMPAVGGVEPIVGKWMGKADTPNGLMDLELEFKQVGSQLQGSAILMQSPVPLSAIKFEDPQLSLELSYGGGDYKLTASVKDGKLKGTWEQIGGDLKGTFNAERQGALAAAAAVSLDGDWNSVAVTPNGELPLKIALKQDGENVTGNLSTPDGTVPMQKGSFSKSKLSFEVTHEGNTYRVEAVLVDGKLSGQWKVVDGTDTGAWKAERPKP